MCLCQQTSQRKRMCDTAAHIFYQFAFEVSFLVQSKKKQIDFSFSSNTQNVCSTTQLLATKYAIDRAQHSQNDRYNMKNTIINNEI